ncbi:hypothetical protein [Shewanella sp. SM21]|uniref:hypothetical protein n=1 Tax=Shewanella sp. SM21 TaxID=2912793 RepID=UPI0021D930A8|nr:hypothetical protein [Shewanella sp. SM21]MCU8089780.1 hypothetical protein [Shewanella sp. SM21]
MKYIVIYTFMFFVNNVFADGDSNGGKIVHVASVDNAILFRVSGNTESDRPICASTGRFSVQKDSPHAPLILTAFATGTKLGNVRGLGSCNIWGNSEDLRWIEVCPLLGC